MPVSDLSVDSELLGYRVEAVLGRGGMSVVYLAEDLRLKRKVALKLLAPALAEDEAFRERFLVESELAASLDHPNIVPIHAAGEANERLFIAMRYVEGNDLKELLRDGPLSAERTIEVCAQVAGALDFAHERGLVHRDVKPSNVLLDARGHVYLADFGLTKRLAEPRAVERGLFGTIDYIAPEQIRGEEVDGRADVYSLGCLLCECLTGEPPFCRATDAAALFAHLEEEPPAPPGLEQVIPKALAKEPHDRYGKCAELVGDAREALGLGEPRPKWWRRPATLTLAGALIALALLVFLMVRVRGWGSRRFARPHRPEDQSGGRPGGGRQRPARFGRRRERRLGCEPRRDCVASQRSHRPGHLPQSRVRGPGRPGDRSGEHRGFRP